MPIGLVGRKCGMTRIFTEAGDSVPVTVIEVLPNRVTTLKSNERDGYSAVQVTVGQRKPDRLSKAAAGHFAKLGVEPGEGLWEFRLNGDEAGELTPGSELKVDMFEAVLFLVYETAFHHHRIRNRAAARTGSPGLLCSPQADKDFHRTAGSGSCTVCGRRHFIYH